MRGLPASFLSEDTSMGNDDDPARRMDHDAEETVREGMSVEGEEVDQAETLASTGDLESSFQEIASGSATGVGLDRSEFTTGAAPIGEADRTEFPGSAAGRGRQSESASEEDENDGDDSWLQDMPRSEVSAAGPGVW
jgi:hypothetical protein